jgi:hypothetical protein
VPSAAATVASTDVERISATRSETSAAGQMSSRRRSAGSALVTIEPAISQSGDADTRRGGDLTERLAEDHTVVTYDRRGLSRSTLHDPGRPVTMPVTMAAHCDDVHRLLAAVTDEPTLTLGCSFGALIGPCPAGRRTTPRTVLDRRCAEEPASLRRTALAEFPGGHNGNLTHPGAFAERLRTAFRS